jgi:LytR cell envelope-related transcriptional attenuator
VFEQPQAQELFNAIAHDTVLPKAAKRAKGRKGKKATAPTTVDTTTTPSRVKVDVENGSGISGVAAQVGDDLTSRGFNVVGTGDASNFNYTSSVIEYAAASDMPAVNTLKAQLSNVQVVQDSSLTPGTITLIVGSSFSALNPQSSSSPSPSASSTPSVSSVSTADGAISANTNICGDSSAFAGPDS